jgi:queuine tRNA-ribosyltransferase
LAGHSSSPFLFGVIQGGDSPQLRLESYQGLQQFDFPGYGFGGWPLDAAGNLDVSISEYIASIIAPEAMRYGMGIGTPYDIVRLVAMGYDLFDVVLPTRDARHGRFYVPSGYLYIKRATMQFDERPVDTSCGCYTCQNYSRRYLHHLWKINDTLFARLATIHNVFFYNQLMRNIRQAIQAERYAEFLGSFPWRKQVVDEPNQ